MALGLQVPIIRRKRAAMRAPVSTAQIVPAPVGGWNSRDALGAMNEMDAVTLTNWFPGTSSCDLRNGYTQHATGFTGQCESLLVYNGASANAMFAFAGTAAYTVTTAGAVGAAQLSGLTNARWQHINVATTAGKYLMAVNGADKAAFYTGSAWARDGDGAPYDITGVDSADCIQINLFKNMVWLVEDATLTAWYLAAGTIGGAATAFRLNGIARKGGYLVAMGTWTIDAGYGVDDLAVFVTSQGEVIVYRGTDPASTATWALVGVWSIGSPVGRRCLVPFAGDLLIITQDGLWPLSGALQSSRVNPRVALSDKIQPSFAQAVTSYGANYGWQVFHFPQENQLYVNVPVNAGSAQQQYVMNVVNRAWCNFTGWSANCFALLNDQMYFGANGYVARAWNTNADNSAVITGFGLQAFNYFKDFTHDKRCTMMRPSLITNGIPALSGSINTDFDLSEPSAALAFTPNRAGKWGSGTWGTATWGSGAVVSQNWQGVSTHGRCLAPALKAAAAGITLSWLSTTVVYERAVGLL